MAASDKKLNILCLHGFRTRKDIMELQNMVLADETRKIANYIYVNAPHAETGPPAPGVAKYFKGGTYQWAEHVHTDDEDDPERLQKIKDRKAALAAKGIKKLGANRVPRNAGVTEPWLGLGASLAFLEETIRSSKVPIHGVLGFSQGALMITLMLAEARFRENPVFSGIKFVLLFSASAPCTAPKYRDELKAACFSIPSCHVYGLDETDEDVEDVRDTVRLFDSASAVVFEHSEGHKYPINAKDLVIYDQVKNWLTGFMHLV